MVSCGKQTAIPFGPAVARVGPALGGEFAGGAVGTVSDCLHEFVIELDRLAIGKADALLKESVLQTHDAQADGPVTHVGSSGRFGRVEVDVDDVIERSDRDGDCFSKSFKIKRAVVSDVRIENDRAKIANSCLFFAAVESDLGAKIRRVDHPDVVLRRAQVAGILERQPWMAGLEESLEHLFPEINGRNRTSVDLALLGETFVMEVALLKLAAVGIMQVWDLV